MLYSTAQVAKAFGVSDQTVRNWVDSGQLPVQTQGQRVWRFKREDIDRFAQQHPGMIYLPHLLADD